MRAVIYTRISRDTDQDGLGVERQRQDCTALVEQHDWTLVEVIVDNDRSAYSGKPRPGYTRLCALLGDRAVDVVVAWHPDRLHRSPRELEDFIDLLEAAGATVATVTAGALDLATPAGRMTARVVGAVARGESEHKSERLRRKARELAEAGKVSGGGSRPFGFEADRVTVRPVEAAMIADAVDRLIGGASLRSVVAMWRASGVPPVGGGRWQATPVRRILTSPRVAGLRSHRGEVVSEAVWPAIVSREQRERLLAVLDARVVRRGPSRRYLLTGGVGRCGLCGEGLVARPKADGRRAYVCASDVGGCGKIRVLAEPLESLVVRSVLVAAREGRFAASGATVGARERLLVELADLRERLTADFYVSGVLSDVAAFRAAERALDARQGEVRGLLARLESEGATAAVRADAGTLAGRWPSMGVEERRQVVEALVARVDVGPAVKGRTWFDPARVTITWPV